ncbi:unnamed protein product, partial [Discosporangium mesarthrocarpum]
FKQQQGPALRPVVTPVWAVSLFMAVGVLFVPFGTWLKLESEKVVELEVQYDGAGKDIECSISESFEERKVSPDKCCFKTCACQVSFSVNKDMAAPVYLYYALENYYQNHRSYVKSRSDNQLEGEV